MDTFLWTILWHFLWTLFDTLCWNFLRTLFMNTFWHSVLTLHLDTFLWGLFVDTFCGHFLLTLVVLRVESTSWVHELGSRVGSTSREVGFEGGGRPGDQWEAWELIMWSQGQWEAYKNAWGMDIRQADRHAHKQTCWLHAWPGPEDQVSESQDKHIYSTLFRNPEGVFWA